MEPWPGVAPLSNDRQWWWDGQRWLPTISLDGRWRFDGQAWRRRNTWRRPSVWVLVGCPLWALVMLLWGPILLLVLGGHNDTPSDTVGRTLVAILVGAAIATTVIGFLFGSTTQLRWVWLAAALGTWAQMAGYGVSMLMQPQPGGIEDLAAGAGLAMFSMPVLLAITGLLWAGAGAGRLLIALRRQARKRSEPQS